MMHGTGLNVLAMPTLMFGGCVVTTAAHKFDPAQALEVMARESVTSIAVAGDAMAKPLLAAIDAGRGAEDEPWNLQELRAIVSSGMGWGHAVMRGFLRALPHVALHEIFGATEAAMATRTVRHPTDIESAVPKFDPVPGLKLLREDGTEIPEQTGEPGLIAVPTEHGRHYHRDPVKTASVFRLIDGVLHAVPGDMGVFERDGSLRPIGRGSSVINTGGEKVFPDEVENVIRELPQILDCVVVGVPHARWGQQVTAVVSVRPGAIVTETDVRTAVRDSLADYKTPKSVLTVPEVPRHANGKPDFTEVHRLLASNGTREASA
jgi:fatty-acyl-CoA synthase